MKHLNILIFCFLILVGTKGFGQASTSSVKAKFLIEGGISAGGDEVARVFFTNGEDQTISAGQGGYLAIGGQVGFSNIKNLLFRLTAGIKYTTTAADNANVRLTRFPVSLLGYWNMSNGFRAGIGVTKQLNARLNGDGFLPDAQYSSSLGPRFELGYKWAGIYYELLNFEDGGGELFSANAIGVSVSFALPEEKK